MFPRSLPWWLALAAPVALTGCFNDCDFMERCQGNVRQVCGAGPDQLVGREVTEHPCVAPSSVCVVLDEHQTLCVTDPPTACDSMSFQPRCDGTVLLDCESGFVIAVDCTDLPRTGRCGAETPGGTVSCL